MPRVIHRVPCRLRFSDPATGRVVIKMGETANLSRDGLAVRIGAAFDEGAWVEVLLPGRHGEPTCLYGRVVHARRVTTGTFEIGIGVTEEVRPT